MELSKEVLRGVLDGVEQGVRRDELAAVGHLGVHEVGDDGAVAGHARVARDLTRPNVFVKGNRISRPGKKESEGK